MQQKTVFDQFEKARRRLGLTCQQLARAAGIATSTYTRGGRAPESGGTVWFRSTVDKIEGALEAEDRRQRVADARRRRLAGLQPGRAA